MLTHRSTPGEVQTAWCAALRSDVYEQIVGRLRGTHPDPDYKRRCCATGVLCDIAGPPLGLGWRSGGDLHDANHGFSIGGNSHGVCREVAEFAGLTDAATDNYPLRAVATMNDNEGLTFAEIADWIEDQDWFVGERSS